jgi:periplasmic mercuric ion binding protein
MKTKTILAIAALAISCSTGLAQTTEATKKATDQQAAKEQLKSGTVKVHGNCEMCKNRIEKAAKSVEGVKSATWDQSTKMLTFQYDEGEWKKNGKSLKSVVMKITEAGHDTQYHKASDKTYKALPKCCQYQRAEQPSNHQHNGHSPMNHGH